MPDAVRYVQFAVHKILTYVGCCNGELQDHCCVDVLVSRTSLLLSIGVCFLRVTCQSWGTVCVIPSTILCVLELRWHCVVPMFIIHRTALLNMHTYTTHEDSPAAAICLLSGVMFAAQSILQTAATLFASVLYNSVYPPTRTILPGMSFLLMAGTLVPPLIAIL